ncbi:protein of unknown function [Vibrio tapetis subsp. tapetis]|uniref:Uncharacterized protein n=1 Tax=Vibrio tapetis subsp. tapetis TaxID=1671868 RepID=A0A2N8ZCI4_9VIBR|nr:protein of unknown function [Vibrio tapetis subsp. tapetis]
MLNNESLLLIINPGCQGCSESIKAKKNGYFSLFARYVTDCE